MICVHDNVDNINEVPTRSGGESQDCSESGMVVLGLIRNVDLASTPPPPPTPPLQNPPKAPFFSPRFGPGAGFVSLQCSELCYTEELLLLLYELKCQGGGGARSPRNASAAAP